MTPDYEGLLKEFNVPAGVLTAEELRLLQEGGVRLDDTEDFEAHPFARADALGAQALRQIYEEQLSMKDKQLAFLQGELRQREQLMEAERRRWESEYGLEKEQLAGELRQARAQLMRNEGQVPLVKEALNQVREMLAGTCSEAVFLRLRELPERELPLSEWLLVSVWELAGPLKRDAEAGKREVGRLREEVRMLTDKQHSLLSELEHYSRLLANKDDDVKRHALNYDNSRRGLELEAEKLREEVELAKEKAARYDELHRDFQFLRQEKELLQERLKFYDDKPQASPAALDDGPRRKAELLQQDKEYLTKENIQLTEKNRRLEDRLDRLEAELLSEKARSQDFLQQLLGLKTEAVQGYEQRVYRELQSLKDKHDHELEAAKNSLVDVYEKQLRFLREALDEKDLRLEVSERQLRERTRDHEQLLLDSRDFQRKLDTDLAEARIQLRIRSEELERVSAIYQETLATLTANKLENDLLREKLNVVKGEYYRAEANGKEESSQLKAQVAVLREQLANYEVIEKEVDEAVVALAHLSPNDPGIFAATLHSAPTASKRRIQQALGLAQRLQAKQKDHESTLAELQKKEGELQKASEELAVARSLLDKTNQPYSYLVGNIEEKEKEVLRLRAENRRLEGDYQRLREEHRELQRQLDDSEKDVQRLLVKRESIKNIQSVLVDLARGPVSSSKIALAIEEIKEALGSTKEQAALPGPDPAVNEPPKASSWYRKLVERQRRPESRPTREDELPRRT